MSKGAPKGNSNSVRTRFDSPSPESAVAIEDYVLDVHDPQFKDGFRKGVNSQKNGQDDVFRRFARLRRDNPDVAGQFLDGQFVRRLQTRGECVQTIGPSCLFTSALPQLYY